MSEVEEAKQALLDELARHHEKHELAKTIGPDFYEPGMMENPGEYEGLYDPETGKILLRTESKGTRYENRSLRLEKYQTGAKLRLQRDPENPFNSNNFIILGEFEDNLGNLSASLCNAIAPLYDAGVLSVGDCSISYLEQIKDRSRYARQAVLFAEINMQLTL